MKKFYTPIVLILTGVVLSGCSSTLKQSSAPTLSLQAQSPVSQALLDQYNSWVGTPYRLGGNTRSGIDCSAFTQVTFRDQFGVDIPRTTRDQLGSGSNIAKGQLKAGDLVFFQTGYKQRHVGIYVQEGQFLHASTSKGVIISRLDNPYWQKHYWTARRPKGIDVR
ncbi:NlpC/P60 family protein [Neptuniibacter sp. QD48_55]|uniref:NlpC/P60 family protein n=1 Tax=Neptuniibacter sp. QD48_55 TaxID=3398212 RepID=UPI0039F5544B